MAECPVLLESTYGPKEIIHCMMDPSKGPNCDPCQDHSLAWFLPAFYVVVHICSPPEAKINGLKACFVELRPVILIPS